MDDSQRTTNHEDPVWSAARDIALKGARDALTAAGLSPKTIESVLATINR